MIKRIVLWLKVKLAAVNSIGREVSYEASSKIVGSTLRGKVQIAGGCRIYDCYMAGPVTIGRYTSVFGPNTDIRAKINPIRIGNFCSIARNVSMQEYNHNSRKLSTYFIGKNVFAENWSNEQISKAAIDIGHDVWIGSHCVLLSGARIGNGAIIAANSVVTGDIPAYAIAAGSPAKVIKYRFSPGVIRRLSALEWWHWPLDEIKANKHLFEKEFDLSLLGAANYLKHE
jgi:virginiamycin A acetyltransferase